MSELTSIARPYAQAAFDYAVESKTIAEWQDMLFFAAQVTENETVKTLLTGSMSADKLAEIFNGVCGEQFDQHGQNFIKVCLIFQRCFVSSKLILIKRLMLILHLPLNLIRNNKLN
jgi:ATP synthase F1 delta subunit